MKIWTPCLAWGLSALPALAHPGHLAEVAGHGHWLGAAALGAAIALGAWAALKGKKTAGEVQDADEPDTDDGMEEAQA